ncbi:MAG: hypothetical protein A3G20_03485 [Acidobacteria bacterium RIFCSPLOWO2_12_FULL_59_11]|nr:MAG: hypothetical protein A3G20_03485 [Acidobacteria bacterium RIFCSPLOWO2_12_FULL_59_11]
MVQAASESAAIEQLTSGPGQGRYIDDTVWTAEPSIEGIPEAVIRQNPLAGRKKGRVPVRVRSGVRLWEERLLHTGGEVIWVPAERYRVLQGLVDPADGFSNGR